jgi:hypothetical protein
MIDTYFASPEVSNSDLTELDQYFNPTKQFGDPEIAFRMGNLFDYSVTEPHKVNYFKRTIEGYPEPFDPETWKIAEQMKKGLSKDKFWGQIKPLCSYQRIFREQLTFEYNSFTFSLRMRCKYDFFMNAMEWGGDLKSTACTSQKQFVEACYHFSYPRSRALYMLLSGAKKDIIIGVSKKNFQVFKVPIVYGDKIFNDGMQELKELAFQWFYLYENF